MSGIQARFGDSLFWRGKAFRRRAGRAIASSLIFIGACVFMIPFFWMLRTSLMHPGQIFIQPIRWIPNPVRFENYLDAVEEIPFWTYTRNTTLISLYTVFGSVLSASLVAYAFARLRSPDKDVLFVILLSTMMLPGEVLMIPQYLIFHRFGWIDTFLPLVVPSYFGGGAFFIFLLRQFFMTLPLELDEAAKLDGASLFRIYWNLVLPLSKPALATVAIFSFFWTWNDFMGPLIYLDSTANWTLALGLRVFAGARIYAQARWHLMMAASILTMIPPVLLFFSTQRTFVQGIVLSGIKG